MPNWIKEFISSPYLTLAAVVLWVLSFIGQLIITERYKESIKEENDRFLEELRWEFKDREQAAKVAQYLALQSNLKENSPKAEYDGVNTIGYELALWLPSDVYKKLGKAAISPTNKERFEVLIEVRKLLLKGNAGNLTPNDIIFHAPGIGKNRK